MYVAIQAKFADALAKQSLVFTPSTEVRKTLDTGVNVVYTLAPALAKKPGQNAKPASEDSPKTGETTKQSPWLPPDESLVVDRLESHTVVLNKFALAKYHFLLVTNEFQPQTLPLSEDDLGAAYSVLRKVNKESGRRHIGFFNSGSQSGASVAHKHIQFMPLPDGFKPFPDTTPEVSVEGSKADKRIPFAHYIAGLAEGMDAEDIVLRYSEVLGRVLTTISRENPGVQRPEINYNLVFTEEWIMATPRRQEKTESGISINSLGTIGMILAKSDEELKLLEEKDLSLLLELGYPYEEVKELRPDHTGYTHY